MQVCEINIENQTTKFTYISSCSDYVFKILLIGDSGVGKSSLMLNFTVSTTQIMIMYQREL